MTPQASARAPASSAGWMPTGAVVQAALARTVSGWRRHVSRRNRLQRRLGRWRRQWALRGFGRGQDAPRGRRLLRGGSDRRRRGRRYLLHRRRNRRGCGTGRRRGRLDRGRRNLGRRQEEQRIEVSLRILDPPNAEIDVRDGQLGDAARADSADFLALGHRCATKHRERAEMDERHGEPLRGQQRERLAAGRHGSRERHRGIDRSQDGRARRRADRDAAVLSRSLGVQLVEVEGLEHGALHGPRPCPRSGGCGERHAGEDGGQRAGVSLSVLQTMAQGTRLVCRCQICLQRRPVERVSRRPRSGARRARPPASARGRPRRAPRPLPAPRARRRQPRPPRARASPRRAPARRTARRAPRPSPRATSS